MNKKQQEEIVRSRLQKECPSGTRTGRTLEIARDLGISPNIVSQHKTGSKPISKYALQMYRWYFAYLDAVK